MAPGEAEQLLRQLFGQKNPTKSLIRDRLMKHVKKKIVFFSLLFLIFSSWQYTQQKKTSLRYIDKNGIEHVLSLPMRDKKRLLSLMEKLFAEDNFAYTLLGSKPISWASYQAPFPFVNWLTFSDSLKKYNRTMYLGWKTWEKYCHLFHLDNFFSETPQCYPGSISNLLINEKQFIAVVKKNKNDFEDVLHRKIEDGFQLLREAKNSSLMNEVLEGHQALMRIVLGYGRENSWQFLEKSKKKDPLGWVWNEKDYWSGQNRTSQFSSPIEQNLSLYSCPSFAGDPISEESLALKKDYLQTKQKVLDYYKNKDFLEATLSLLAGFHLEEKYHYQITLH